MMDYKLLNHFDFYAAGDVGFPKLKTIDVAQLLQTKSVYVSGMTQK